MEVLINVNGQIITAPSMTGNIIGGTQNVVKFIFDLSNDWNDLTTFAQFCQGDNTYDVYLDENNSVYMPREITGGRITVALQGNHGSVVAKTNALVLYVYGDPIRPLVTGTGMTLTLYEQMLEYIHNFTKGDKGDTPVRGVDYWTDEDKAAICAQLLASDDVTTLLEQFNTYVTAAHGYADNANTSATAAGQSAYSAEQYASQAEISASNAANSEQAALTSKNEAYTSEINAKASETNAKTSENNSKASENTAAQALSDLLHILGNDVATLVNGKIPASQIPSIATTEIYHAESDDEMDVITPERGDICIRTDENKSYIYNDGWVYLASPTDYSERSGHAETSGTAENANMINGHRLIQISSSQWESAVKDPDTYYLIYEEEQS